MVGQQILDIVNNSKHKDRVLSVVEVEAPKDSKEADLLVNITLPYSVLPTIDIEALKNKFADDINNNKHVIIILSDFDIEKIEDKLKIKGELYDYLIKEIKNKGIKAWIHILLLEDIKQISMDSKFEFFDLLAKYNPVFDKGFHEMIRLTVLHKNIILSIFNKYVVAYVLAGSHVKGRAKETSDIDVYVVIDDTDVKAHTFVELKEKLIHIITQKAFEAMAMTGTKKVLHPQVYTLTEFWLAMAESNPVIITFLRDGLALYDRGMFIAWKQMLLKGILKPSREAAETFLKFANSRLHDVENKLKMMLMEDLALSIITAAQAVIMDYGLLPPDPKETPEFLKRIFIDDKKILEEEYYDIAKQAITIRKDIEHGKKTKVTAEEVGEWLEKAKKFVKRMENLKIYIDSEKEKEELDYAIQQLQNYMVEAEYLFGTNIKQIIEEKLPYEKEFFMSTLERINKYKSGMVDMVNVTELIRDVKRLIRLLRNLVDTFKIDIMIKHRISVNSKGVTYSVYLTKDYIYVVGEKVKKYNYNGELLDEFSKETFDELLLKEIHKYAINKINPSILEAFSKIFGEFEILL